MGHSPFNGLINGLFLSSMVWLMGCFSLQVVRLRGFLLSVIGYWALPPFSSWLWIFTPSVWVDFGSWPHQFGLNVGFTPLIGFEYGLHPISLVGIWVLPHQWFGGLYPISGLKGFTPDNVLIHLQWCYPQWRLPSVCNVIPGHFLLDIPILSQQSYHYIVIWVSRIFIHSCIHSMHSNIIYTWSHYHPVYYFNCIS
jgi:hypothetical protein